MPDASDRRGEAIRTTRHGWLFHGPLVLGAALFLLPLVWMVAISLKPLDQTMEPGFDPLPRAYWVRGPGGAPVQVYREKRLAETRHFVEVADEAAGELNGTTHWVLGGDIEREELEGGPSDKPKEIATFARLPDGQRLQVKILREKDFAEPGYLVKVASGRLLGTKAWVRKADRKGSVARLADGQQVEIEVLEEFEASEEEPPWLVRQWKDKDVDTKLVTDVQAEPDRYVAVVPPGEIRESVRPLWINYPTALRRTSFLGALLNTLLVCMMGVVGVTVSSVLVAYGFAFIDFRGKRLLFVLTLATMMIPFPAVMVPLYSLFRALGWVGTFKPLWVPAWFGSAFFIFLLRQFFLGIPRDLADSARLAGASELGVLWHVVLPLARPALAMVALFHFLYLWKDFMGPLLYLNDKARFTLSLALQHFHGEQGGTPWHLMMAASTVFSVPLIVLFFLTVKTFIRSITMTGMKG